MFVWLRWTALSQPRRRRFWPLPAALMTAVVVVAFFMTFFSGFILEREWAWQPGTGLFAAADRVWFVVARRTTIGATALARPIRRAARGVMAITSRALAFASRWFDAATVAAHLRAADRRLAARMAGCIAVPPRARLAAWSRGIHLRGHRVEPSDRQNVGAVERDESSRDQDRALYSSCDCDLICPFVLDAERVSWRAFSCHRAARYDPGVSIRDGRGRGRDSLSSAAAASRRASGRS